MPDQRFDVSLTRKGDGSLSMTRAEILVVMLAEGIELTEAWRAIPGTSGDAGTNAGGSAKYRNRIVKHPVFLARLKELEEEKVAFEGDPILGEALWAAKQTYRMAVAKMDVATMHRASSNMLEIARLRVGNLSPSEASAPAQPIEEKRPVGRPGARAPNGTRSPAQIRRELMEISTPDEPSEHQEAVDMIEEDASMDIEIA